jgi:hypothetical protein
LKAGRVCPARRTQIVGVVHRAECVFEQPGAEGGQEPRVGFVRVGSADDDVIGLSLIGSSALNPT